MMGSGSTRRRFMRETSIAAALTTLTASSTARAAAEGTAYLCVTCGTQFAESAEAAGALRDLRGRAAVRQPRRPGVDDARATSDDAQEHDQERRGPPLLDQHRAEVRHRPAGVPDPDRRGERPLGLRGAARRRDGLADQGAGRDRRDRDLAPALLHVDGGMEPRVRRRADPHPRSRAPLGDAPRPVHPLLERRKPNAARRPARWSAPGGHFEGYQVLLWPAGADGRGALMAGDQPQICMDPKQVSFMWSYPNYIPLNAPTIRHVMECLELARIRPDLRRVLRPRQGDRPLARARKSSAAPPNAI